MRFQEGWVNPDLAWEIAAASGDDGENLVVVLVAVADGVGPSNGDKPSESLTR
jgi:hypothetical protein